MSEKSELVEYGYKEDNGYGAICAKFSPLQLALRVCKKYNLDPDLNELKMIKTQLGLVPYITASGLRRITTPMVKSLKTTCIDIDKENKIPNWVVYRAEVETIDGRTFTGEGAFDESEIVGKTKRTLHLMRTRAETRAVSRALRFLVKGLDIYDELPDDVKQNEIPLDKEELTKQIEKHEDAITVTPIHNKEFNLMEELLNTDLEVKDTTTSSLKPSSQDTPKENSELKEILSLMEDNVKTDGFEGIDFLVPYLEELMRKNENTVPNIGTLLNHIRKRTKVAKYLWDWYCEFKKKLFVDQPISDISSKKNSIPLTLYEQFTKTIFPLNMDLPKTPEMKWHQLAGKEEDLYLFYAFMFYFLYSMYYSHVKEKATEYPDKQLIKRLYTTSGVQKWVIPVFKLQDELEIPEWSDA